MHPGQSDNFSATGLTSGAGDAGNEQASLNTWAVHNNTGVVGASSTPSGWSVTYVASKGFTVTCPSTAAVGTVSAGTGYTATYCTSYKITLVGDSDIETDSGPAANFDITNPPAKPGARPGPAYDWETSVGGVNLANGNKLTSIPVVGWTQRGGLPVDFTLYHSSEAGWTGWCGAKWTFTDDAVLGVSGQTVTVRWGNGTSYSFTLSGSTYYTCNQRGVHNTLTGSGSAYDILTQDQTKYHFSSFGNGIDLVSVTDRNGNAVVISRYSSGQVSYIQDCTGRKINVGYDGAGRISTVTDPLNRQWTLGYTDGSSNLNSVTLPPLNGQTYSVMLGYDGNHNVTSITSPDRRTTGASYNGDGSVQWVKDGQGHPLSFGYSATATTVTDANNHATTYNFLYSTMASVTDPLGKTASTVFDINNALVQSTDRRGHSSYTTPDPHNGTSLNTTDADGNTTSAVYNGNTSYVSSTKDANGKTTQYSYVGSYNLSQVLDPLSVNANALTDYPSTWYGLPDWTRDANSHVTYFGYDNNPAGTGSYTGGYGILTSTQDPNGLVTTSHYFNALGWVDWTTDNQQHKTSFAYDNWGRVVQTTLPDGTVTTTEYDLDGNVLSVNGGYNRPYAIRCGQGAGDGWGGDGGYSGGNGVSSVGTAIDTSLVSNPAPQSVYQFERWGNAPLSYTLGGLYPNRLYTVRLHFAENFFNGPGQRLFDVAINGQTKLFGFDIYATAGGMYRAVVREFAVKADGSGSVVISFTDRGGGSKVSGIEVTNRGVSSAYDADNRRIGMIDGRGVTTRDTYEQTDTSGHTQYGLLSWKTDGAGHTTRYTYTNRDELANAAYANGTSEGWTYDENGNTQTYTQAAGCIITYQYDSNNLLSHILYQNTSVNHNVDFTYDFANRRQTMADGIGTNWRWDYDDDGRLLDLITPYNTVSYGYYPNNDANYRGLLAKRTESNGVGTWNYTTYDSDNNLLAMVNPFNELTQFHYDTLGRQDQVQNAIHQWTTYGFDALSRVQSIAWGTGAGDTSTGWENYAHDPAGALVQKTQNDGSTSSYGYDGAGQITWEQRAGGNAAIPAYAEGYTYDGNGNRLSKTLSDASHAVAIDRYTYQPNSDRLDHVSGGIVGSRAYTYDTNGNVRSITANNQTLWLSTDYNGMPFRIDYNTGPGQGSVYATMPTTG